MIKTKEEEKAEKLYSGLLNLCNELYHPNEVIRHCMDAFIAGARWAQREQLSEKDKEIERLNKLLASCAYAIWKGVQSSINYDDWLTDFFESNNLKQKPLTYLDLKPPKNNS